MQLAYRWWFVEDGLLRSPKAGTFWLPELDNMAHCLFHQHFAPAKNCECGLYGRLTLDRDKFGCDRGSDAKVRGIIQGWGKTEEGIWHRRYRYARPVAFANEHHSHQELAQRYGVLLLEPGVFGALV